MTSTFQRPHQPTPAVTRYYYTITVERIHHGNNTLPRYNLRVICNEAHPSSISIPNKTDPIQGITARKPKKKKTPSQPGNNNKKRRAAPPAFLSHQRRGRRRTTGVTTPLVALHVAAHREGLSAAGVRAAEGLLARVGVGVDAQRGRAGESLVAGAADVAVVVLLVGGCAGGGEVVVVLPGGCDWGDEGW